MNDMVRVLHYIGSLEFGGSQSFVMEIFRNIDRERIIFDFITFQNEAGPLYDEIIHLGGKIYECPKYNGKNHFLFVKWWNDFLKEHPEYGVVHGHVRSVASIYLPIVRKHKRFAIIHSHSVSNGRGLTGVAKFLLQIPVRYQADYYMACSRHAGEWLFGHRIVNSRRYTTVPNAVNGVRFAYNKQMRAAVRAEYGLKDCFVIGHVGRFTEVKNHRFLLQILRKALKMDKNIRLMMVGGGILEEAVKQKCSETGILKYVIFTGERTNTEYYYQAMDVLAFPSKWEGLGITVIEAQTGGLRCVVSTGIPEEVDLGANLVTWLALDQGPEAWAKELLRDRSYVRMSRVKELRSSGYDITDHAKKMQRFYIKADHKVREKHVYTPVR